MSEKFDDWMVEAVRQAYLEGARLWCPPDVDNAGINNDYVKSEIYQELDRAHIDGSKRYDGFFAGPYV